MSSKTALIILDVQVGIVRMNGGMDMTEYVAKVASAAAAARKAGVLVVQVTTSYRPGYEDASPRNAMTMRVKNASVFNDMHETAQLHPVLAEAAAGDIHIKKKRVSALYGNDLDIVLRSSGIEHIAIAGLSTSGAVLSTVRQASDMDYDITVLTDLCADPKADVHKILIEKVLPAQAAMVDAERWLAQFEEIEPAKVELDSNISK